jgi:Leucine rich repeat
MSTEFAADGETAAGVTVVEPRSSFSIRPARAEDAAARARECRRLHHRQMIRRGIITTCFVALVGLLTTLALPIMREIRAWWLMEASRMYIVWHVSEQNWMSGGVAYLNYSPQYTWPSHTRDIDLEFLPRLLNFESLNLADCPVTEQGLDSIRGLNHLKSLNVAWLNHLRYGSPETGLSDACLVPIQSLSQLKSLTLAGNRITDAGLAMISRMPNLEVLDLEATDVTDAGLLHLHGLKNLKSLSLGGGTLATPQGVKSLQSAIPDLQVEFYNDPELERVLKQFRRQPR